MHVSLQYKYKIILFLLLYSLCLCEQHTININSKIKDNYKNQHWEHSNGNSSILINETEIDVINLSIATKTKSSIKIQLINPIWENYKHNAENLVLPDSITISKLMNFRGIPTSYIQIFPWRINNEKIQKLTQGKIQIYFNEIQTQSKLHQPHSINTKKQILNRHADGTQYLILHPNTFLNSAQKIADIHNHMMPIENQLITEIKSVEEIYETYENIEHNLAIRQYLFDTYNLNEEDGDLIFLLLFGDETLIPPIFDENNNFPSDDYYSTPELHGGYPQLITGRIPVDNFSNANKIAEKINEYIINPTPGIWKSRFALIADDMHKSCTLTNTQMEKSHTIYTDSLYMMLKPLTPSETYYGVHYELQQSNGCTKPNLTQNLINNINNGFALINYIGHGSNQSWGDEKYLDKSRDLASLNVKNNKLAIWVAGTCSFGNYYENNSFMEELLIKEDGAIAIIATTDGIHYTSNWQFLKNLFGKNNTIGIEDFINGSDIPTSIPYYSIGELVWKTKNLSYKFHVFGNPAMPLPFPKKQTDIINTISQVKILEQQEIIFTSSTIQNASMQFRGPIKKYDKIIDLDTLSYNLPGELYTQIEFNDLTNCFRISQDVIECNECATMYVYEKNNLNEKIQTIENISILTTDNFYTDTEGPNIQLYQNNIKINDGSAIFSNLNMTAILSDFSGINLIESIGHGMKYSFNNNLTTISPNDFTYQDCNTGYVTIPLPSLIGKSVFYIEAWDGLNNKTSLELKLELLDMTNGKAPIIKKVYPIPNPFSEQTYFTMISSHFPINIKINIHTINGLKIKTIEKNINECSDIFGEGEDAGCFIRINWDGKNKYGREIANGTYLYHLEAKLENGEKYEKIFKIAKIK